MAPFFLAKNAQTTLYLKGCYICLQEDRRVKVSSICPEILECVHDNKNDLVTNCFYATLILSPKMISFLKLQKTLLCRNMTSLREVMAF